MIFSSGLFLFLFLGFSFIYLCLRKTTTLRLLFVVLFSYYFYYKSSGTYFVLLGVVTLSDFILARIMEQARTKALRRTLLIISLTINLGLLCYFKYTNFFYEMLAPLWGGEFHALDIFLPVGISFFTFQSLSYTIDVYRGELKALHNPLDYAFFVSFFPQLVAGPHRACPRLHPPDTTPGCGHSRDVRTRRLLHRCRTFQESHPVRLYQRKLRRAHIRQPGTVFRHRKPLWRLWLCAANLLRLLRLQRHGHRHRPPVRIPLPAQLPLALQVGLHHRVLATLGTSRSPPGCETISISPWEATGEENCALISTSS